MFTKHTPLLGVYEYTNKRQALSGNFDPLILYSLWGMRTINIMISLTWRHKCCQRPKAEGNIFVIHKSLWKYQHGTCTTTLFNNLIWEVTILPTLENKIKFIPNQILFPSVIFIPVSWHPPPLLPPPLPPHTFYLVLELKTNLIVWLKLLYATCFQGNIWPYTDPPPGDQLPLHSNQTSLESLPDGSGDWAHPPPEKLWVPTLKTWSVINLFIILFQNITGIILLTSIFKCFFPPK